MRSSKRKYITAGLIAAGSAAVAAYAVRHRHETPGFSGARVELTEADAALKDVLAAQLAVDWKPRV
jgi:hypothetical protein